ncbi:MAG: hypothetical protein ACO1TE_05890 [Prosthecobacter sp.]
MRTFFLAASDFDPFQAAIIGIALLAGFIKWLWENWRMKSDAAQRDFTPQDPEELRRREEAWQRQVGPGQGQGGQQQPPPPPRRAPPVAPSAWDELRKAWDELKETARQTQNPEAQPRPKPQSQTLRPTGSAEPLRPQRQPQQAPRRGSVGASLSAAEAKLPATREAAAAASAAAAQRALPSAPPMVERRGGPSAALLGTLQNLRHDPALLRQAVLLHEILGPPKALQSSTDPAN